MRWITLQASVKCGHGASVKLKAQQSWLTIEGVPVLIQPDPVGCSISLCPNVSTNLVPCTATTSVITGYSAFIKVDGRPVTLDTLLGPTNSAPPSTYSVTDPGQSFVGER